MSFQLGSDVIHSSHESFGKSPGLEFHRHRIPHILPENFRAARMHCFVADNPECLSNRSHVNQHGIPLTRLVHTEFFEADLRSNKSVRTMVPRNVNANLTGCLPLSFRNRSDDFFLFQFGNKFFRVHITSSLLRRRRRNFHHRC